MRNRNIGLLAAFLATGPARGTVHVYEKEWPVPATEDLTGAQYKLVTLSGTIQQSGSIGRLAGICKHKINSGYNAGVVYEGATKAFVGGAVSTPGWPLKSANSGWMVACASGDPMVARFFGTTAASGDIAPVLIDVANFGVWNG